MINSVIKKISNSRYIPFVIFTISILAIIYSILVGMIAAKREPQAIDGYLKTSNIDMRSPVMLRGLWEYYDSSFLFPSYFHFEVKSKDGKKPEYIQVPGSTPNPYGFGTYRLVFTCVTTSRIFAIKSIDISSASRIYVDGILIATYGNPSTFPNVAISDNAPRDIVFSMDILKASHEIIIHISNYSHHKGGIVSPLYFGSQIKMYELSNKFYFSDDVSLVSLWLLTILLSLILILRIKLGNILYLLIFSIVMTLHLISFNQQLINSISQYIGYIAYLRIKFAVYPLLGIFLWLYLNIFGADSVWRKINHTIIIIGIFLTASIIFFPLYFQGILVASSYLYIIIVSLFCFIRLLPRIKENDFDALLQLMGLLFFSTSLILRFIYNYGRIDASTYSGLLAFFIIGFVVIQLFYVAQQMARIYLSNEVLVQRMVVSDRLRKELLQVTSHELRTPLHGILNISSSVIAKIQKKEATKQNIRDLGVILSLAQRMKNIINDLYGSTSSKENNNSDFQPISLNAEVNTVFEMFRYLTNPNRLKLINRIRPDASTAYGDSNKLWQILNNLIGNAVKYTESGSITIQAIRKTGNKIHISVIDTGAGIPMIETEKIFQRSFRIPTDIENIQGQGLGLYISRLLVEEMNGTIWVERTAPDKGTTITFTLPYCENILLNVPKNSNQEKSVPAFTTLTVLDTMVPVDAKLLVVDDNKENLKVVTTIFEDCNFSIDTADSGEATFLLLQNRMYDIVILDVMMPDMTGFEVCQKIRTRYTPFELPVLLLTAHDSTEDILTGFWSGANDYVIKPADNIELRARVFNLIGLKQSVSSTIEKEIAFLQAQIKPHFLYNALNTISAIALTDGIEASELIDNLGFYLRKCFQVNNTNKLVSILTEIELVDAYLCIEKARFGDRLIVNFEIDKDINFFLPLLTIQPIVENAIRHNSLSSNDIIKVNIEIINDKNKYVIKISDNGKGIDINEVTSMLSGTTKKAFTGIGLQNVNRVLKLRYNRSLEFVNPPGGGTEVSITIPEKTQNNEEKTHEDNK